MRLCRVRGLLILALLMAAPVQAKYLLRFDTLAPVMLAQAVAQQAPVELREFYRQRDYQPVWLHDGKPSSHGRSLLRELERAERHGLNPRKYGLPALRMRLQAQPAAAEVTALELDLTRAYLAFITDLATGRFVPTMVDPRWHITPPQPQPAAYLAALEEGDVSQAVRRFAPDDPDYWRLVSAGEQLRQVTATGGWPRLTGAKILTQGMKDPEVLQLRRRLLLSGDLSERAGAKPALFDARLTRALMRFQHRHGLDADGVLGPNTRAALNVPAAARWRQLMVSLERHRWLPRQKGAHYLLVNAARYELEVVRDGQVQLRMPVIVGEQDAQTPAFADEMTYLVFNPYWNVPESIVREEIAPQILADADLLTRRNMELLEHWQPDAAPLDPLQVDWQGYASGADVRFPHRLRQAPGPSNPLGRVKFMFPNQYAIYLHDTPNDSLFARRQRAFSHGCIRVAEPLKLAEYLLEESGWRRRDVDAALADGENRKVWLARPLPVYIVYSTAWTDSQGRPHYRDDLYGRDGILQAQLIDAGPAAAPVTIAWSDDRR